jgi:hypothetical protein
MQSNTFKSLRPQIEEAIDLKLQLPTAPQDPEGFTLIEGFFVLPLQQTLTAAFAADGDTITMVGIVGNTTKVVHYFPIKALLSAAEAVENL